MPSAGWSSGPAALGGRRGRSPKRAFAFVALDVPGAGGVKRSAAAQDCGGVLVNVVDRPGLCAISPPRAMLDRDPVLVGDRHRRGFRRARQAVATAARNALAAPISACLANALLVASLGMRCGRAGPMRPSGGGRSMRRSSAGAADPLDLDSAGLRPMTTGSGCVSAACSRRPSHAHDSVALPLPSQEPALYYRSCSPRGTFLRPGCTGRWTRPKGPPQRSMTALTAEDADLVSRLRRGDFPRRRRELYQRHGAALLRFGPGHEQMPANCGRQVHDPFIEILGHPIRFDPTRAVVIAHHSGSPVHRLSSRASPASRCWGTEVRSRRSG